jgi:hypothetical protein
MLGVPNPFTLGSHSASFFGYDGSFFRPHPIAARVYWYTHSVDVQSNYST